MPETSYKTDELIAKDIETYLKVHEQKSLLRFITCGSVDDGKSTLIGRLLYDSRMIFEDQLDQLKSDSKRQGAQGEEIDFALLVDGLAAEREQGITIDVAYRYFATEKRKFIVADTPGHEQFTRNMVTGASTAELAIVLIDARKGVLTQTKRHSFLCNLIGIKNIILAVNKMDLIDYDQRKFDKIVQDYRNFASKIGLFSFSAIPISGIKGDNITILSKKTPWHIGSTLLEMLEDVDLEVGANQDIPFSMPVQYVNRPNLDFRGFAGNISRGTVRLGDEIRVLPGGKTTYVKSIVTFEGELEQAVAGQSVTLTTTEEIDCSRGQILVASKSPLQIADQFEVTLIWMDEEPLLPGRSYYLKTGTQTVSATVAQPKYEINVNTLEKLASKSFSLNGIGLANITLDRNIAFDNYSNNRELGGFILIDAVTNATVGAGLINFALRRSHNIHWQSTDVSKVFRSRLKNQKPAVLWMTGLSGSGKSTIANAVEQKLANMSRHTFLLDGDNVRHGLNKDLGFTDADRIENIRRIGEVAKLMTESGLIVITAFISPFSSERQMVRDMMDEGEFLEVHIDTPLEVAEERDEKGLYAKARAGSLKNFTGIDSPYEKPEKPEIYIDTTKTSVEEAVDIIVEKLMEDI